MVRMTQAAFRGGRVGTELYNQYGSNPVINIPAEQYKDLKAQMLAAGYHVKYVYTADLSERQIEQGALPSRIRGKISAVESRGLEEKPMTEYTMKVYQPRESYATPTAVQRITPRTYTLQKIPETTKSKIIARGGGLQPSYHQTLVQTAHAETGFPLYTTAERRSSIPVVTTKGLSTTGNIVRKTQEVGAMFGVQKVSQIPQGVANLWGFWQLKKYQGVGDLPDIIGGALKWRERLGLEREQVKTMRELSPEIEKKLKEYDALIAKYAKDTERIKSKIERHPEEADAIMALYPDYKLRSVNGQIQIEYKPLAKKIKEIQPLIKKYETAREEYGKETLETKPEEIKGWEYSILRPRTETEAERSKVFLSNFLGYLPSLATLAYRSLKTPSKVPTQIWKSMKSAPSAIYQGFKIKPIETSIAVGGGIGGAVVGSAALSWGITQLGKTSLMPKTEVTVTPVGKGWTKQKIVQAGKPQTSSIALSRQVEVTKMENVLGKATIRGKSEVISYSLKPVTTQELSQAKLIYAQEGKPLSVLLTTGGRYQEVTTYSWLGKTSEFSRVIVSKQRTALLTGTYKSIGGISLPRGQGYKISYDLTGATKNYIVKKGLYTYESPALSLKATGRGILIPQSQVIARGGIIQATFPTRPYTFELGTGTVSGSAKILKKPYIFKPEYEFTTFDYYIMGKTYGGMPAGVIKVPRFLEQNLREYSYDIYKTFKMPKEFQRGTGWQGLQVMGSEGWIATGHREIRLEAITGIAKGSRIVGTFYTPKAVLAPTPTVVLKLKMPSTPAPTPTPIRIYRPYIGAPLTWGGQPVTTPINWASVAQTYKPIFGGAQAAQAASGASSAFTAYSAYAGGAGAAQVVVLPQALSPTVVPAQPLFTGFMPIVNVPTGIGVLGKTVMPSLKSAVLPPLFQLGTTQVGALSLITTPKATFTSPNVQVTRTQPSVTGQVPISIESTITSTGVSTRPRLGQANVSGLEVKAAQEQVIRTEVAQAQAVKAAQALRTAPALVTAPFAFPLETVPPPVIVPPLIPGKAVLPLAGFVKAMRKVQAYALFVKRGGKFFQLGTPLPKWEAVKKGQEFVSTTLAATFKLAKVKQFVTGVEKPIQVSPEFRPYKIVHGKKVYTPLQWIEKRPYRLKQKGEIEEILGFKKKGKKKKRGRFSWV